MPRSGYGIWSTSNEFGVEALADRIATVICSEIITALNKPDAVVLAIVQFSAGFASESRYIREPFQKEPDFGATSVTYKLSELLERSEPAIC